MYDFYSKLKCSEKISNNGLWIEYGHTAMNIQIKYEQNTLDQSAMKLEKPLSDRYNKWGEMAFAFESR